MIRLDSAEVFLKLAGMWIGANADRVVKAGQCLRPWLRPALPEPASLHFSVPAP